jgi:hypothetical protein
LFCRARVLRQNPNRVMKQDSAQALQFSPNVHAQGGRLAGQFIVKEEPAGHFVDGLGIDSFGSARTISADFDA